MELEKKKIYMNRRTARVVTQVTMDEDRNVPDSRPDIAGIITGRGRVEPEELRCSEERGNLKGLLRYQLLYRSDGEAGQVYSLDGILPINENVRLPGVEENDHLTVDWALEDLSMDMIHSRKVRIRAVITFTITAERLYQEELVTDVRAEEPLETRSENWDVTRIALQKRENFRVAEELELGSSKPNLGELIWQEVELRGVDCRPVDAALAIRGDLDVFVLYRGDGDSSMPVQWEEYSVPFSGQISLLDCVEGMVPDVDVRIIHQELNPAEDSDGENRKIMLEAILELQIRLYESEQVPIIRDVYSPVKEAVPEEKKTAMMHILVRNSSRCRIQERLQLPDGGRILQICHGSGQVIVDETAVTEDGLAVEGALQVQILYISADDERPMKTLNGSLPFQHVLEAKNMDRRCSYRLRWNVESLSVMMLGLDEAEVKATLALEALVLTEEEKTVLTSVRLVPYDPEKIRALPGIVGYRVQPEDTLWKIAKKFYTTVEGIREVNREIGEEVQPGQKLILIKQAETFE